MTIATIPAPVAECPGLGQSVVIDGIDWATYERLLDACGTHSSGVRFWNFTASPLATGRSGDASSQQITSDLPGTREVSFIEHLNDLDHAESG